MSDLKEQVLQTIYEYNLISDGDKIVVAVSGGPDSISLLHILLSIASKFNLHLCVCHVNHGLRENAKIDEEYVMNFCKENNIECFVEHIDVAKYAMENKLGLEEAGRIARYSFFEKILKQKGYNKIAIAHNKNDRAETVILNIIRGSGINGLIGIEPKKGKYIRPLLKLDRNDIENYCTINNLNPRIDETNMENNYNRNKVRNIMLPYIKKEFNPNIINTIDRLSDIVKQTSIFVDSVSKTAYEDMLMEKQDNYIKINLKKFNNKDIIIRKNIIFYISNELLGTINGIEKINVEDIIKLAENNIGNKYLMPNKNLKVSMKNKQLYFEKQ